MRRMILQGWIGLILSCTAFYRTDFSLEKIKAPWVEKAPCIEVPFEGRFYFLDRGRQSFVFLSEDGATVLKFFDRSYFEKRWYDLFCFPSIRAKKKEKRKERKSFYEQGYLLAWTHFPEETSLLSIHMAPSQNLGKVELIDRASRSFIVDLNEIPFVAQRRVSAFYPSLEEKEIKEGIKRFFLVIEKRLSLGIVDKDRDVAHNVGWFQDSPIILDPGRWVQKEVPLGSKQIEEEWMRSTGEFRKWLLGSHPEEIPFFDAMLKEKRNKIS